MTGREKRKDWTSDLKSRIPDLLNDRNAGPLVAEIGATYGCNHACIHCGFQQYTPYRSSKHFLPLDKFIQFADDFLKLGGKEIWFAGNGEPYLNPDLINMIEYGSSIGLSVGISSNAVPVTEEKIKRTIENISWAKFSVNGATDTDYALVHQCRPRDFKRMVSNLKMFTGYRDLSENSPRIRVQFIVMEENWNHIMDMVELHNDVNTDELIFRNVIKKECDMVAVPDDVRQSLSDAEENRGVTVLWDSFDVVPDASWDICYGINFRINLTDEGELYTCCRDLVIPSRYGNIFKKRFIDIWKSDVKLKVFQEVYSDKERTDCKKWCQCARDNILINNVAREHGQL
jgi:MoaA/NifB/PqqE/SkfB family radical SAM enzyme